MKRRLRPLAGLALVALLSAGCSSGSSSNGSGGDNPTAASGNRKATGRDQGVKFADCMRENGVKDFPDPDASGDFDYGVSVSGEVWTKAVDACQELKPPGALSSERDPAQQKEGLKFAQCVREHGVKDFPDPINGEPLIDTNRIPSSEKDGGMDILNAAIHTCDDLLHRAAAGR